MKMYAKLKKNSNSDTVQRICYIKFKNFNDEPTIKFGLKGSSIRP